MSGLKTASVPNPYATCLSPSDGVPSSGGAGDSLRFKHDKGIVSGDDAASIQALYRQQFSLFQETCYNII